MHKRLYIYIKSDIDFLLRERERKKTSESIEIYIFKS